LEAAKAFAPCVLAAWVYNDLVDSDEAADRAAWRAGQAPCRAAPRKWRHPRLRRRQEDQQPQSAKQWPSREITTGAPHLADARRNPHDVWAASEGLDDPRLASSVHGSCMGWRLHLLAPPFICRCI